MPRLTLRAIAWTTVSALLALPASAQAAGEGGQDIPITDPLLLEMLGIEPDATNVYATPQALRELMMDPAERAAVEQARLEEYLAAGENSPSGGPYGDSTPGFSAIGGLKFLPRDPDATTSYDWSALFGRYCLSGSSDFYAQFEDLPHGAKLEDVRLWYNDSSVDEDVQTDLIAYCHPDSGPGVPVTTVLGSSMSTGSAGQVGGFINTSVDIDGQSCFYVLRVQLDCSAGSSLAIGKARARWFRQVSPGPVTATFNDVPTNHPFYQHIEALAASEITGGCGDGSSYCPNAPLTRGEMAVFLAKALGLHWGSF